MRLTEWNQVLFVQYSVTILAGEAFLPIDIVHWKDANNPGSGMVKDKDTFGRYVAL